MIEIRHRWSNAVIYTAETAIDLRQAVIAAVAAEASLEGASLDGANLTRANLTRANLVGANLTRANLTRANLVGANLTRANLVGANLVGANLYGANLVGANLYGANLYGAQGLTVEQTNQLALLLANPGSIWAYKLVTKEMSSPIAGRYIDGTPVTYEIGQEYRSDVDESPSQYCGIGLHVATPQWICNHVRQNSDDEFRVLRVEIFRDAPVVIPLVCAGKFRCGHLRIDSEVPAEEWRKWLGEKSEDES